MSWETTIELQRYFFTELEKPLAEHAGLKASTFVYSSGVAALCLTNQVGHLITLPFQGQQIWDAVFRGRTLTMKSMFTEPAATTSYLHTYGGFVIHCGAVAMGVPTKDDSHPLHGELPNAPYQTAQLVIGEDERGAYMGLTGTYQYTVAFSHNYIARPLVKLYANSSRISVSVNIKNLKRSEMELMYLCHANFRPVDNGQLVYSAHSDAKHVRVRSSIPSHISPKPGYREFVEQLAKHPEEHHVLKPGLGFDPEIVFFIEYLADEKGWAHSMQLHPDGAADFISHRPAELDHGVRWISRTADQDCLGIILPATAESEGYSAEKAKGNLKILPPGGEFHTNFELGSLTASEAGQMADKIQKMVGGKKRKKA